MKILVIGGFGYLGGIISDLLYWQKIHEITVLDCCMWGDLSEYDTNTGIKVVQADVFQVDSLTINEFDKVIWCCDIDVSQFYNFPISKKYVSKNLNVFEQFSNILGNRLIYVGEYYMGNNSTYINFLNSKLQLCMSNNNSSVWIPDLYGASKRMRIDTFMNNMFCSAYYNGIISIQKALQKRPVASVWFVAEEIVKIVTGIVSHISICNFNYSDCEYAFITKMLFEKKEKPIEIMAENEIDVDNGFIRLLPELQILDPHQKDIENSFSHIMKSLEHDKSLVSDLLKDKNNNSAVLAGYANLYAYTFLNNL